MSEPQITTDERRATLLVVEDDAHLLWGIRDILELDHYNVLTAQDGQEALDILQNTDTPLPDLIVSDIMMPHMDGLQFLEEVRKVQDWVRIPFIFLTARGEKGDVQRGKKMGVDDYIIKPFDPEDLTIAVRSRLQRMGDIEIYIDDTKEKAIEEEKKKLVTMLNHELRTPLTLIVAYAEMLKDYIDVETPETEINVFLKGVNDGAERMRRLIENFILTVEIESGDAEKTFVWRSHKIENLDILVKTAHEQVFRNENAGRVCNITMPDSVPVVFGDQSFIIVMLRELLDNAVKFSNDTDEVQLSVTPAEADMVCITIKDSGRGIPTDEQENVWKMFYQINREKLEDQGGGVGLTLVQQLARIHKGRVEMDSTEGTGSTFHLYLPTNK
ncbi:MAG: response regulator [Aggregatilineales bacterium]